MSNSNKKASEILANVNQMSSKFSEVGRNIVFAIIAGTWVLYNNTKNLDSTDNLDLALILAFIYLLIDLIYYGLTMIIYNSFLKINTKDSEIEVKNEEKIFASQQRWRKCFMWLTGIKIILLIFSTCSIFCFLIH